MTNEYGKLYILNNYITGKWLNNVIQILTNLYCDFIKKSDEYHNGIKINIDYEGNNISKNIAIFLVNCYIIKYEHIDKEDGEELIYLSPINIVLDRINRSDYCLNEINTILNHPHFEGCTNINDINDKILTIPNLNNRF